MALFECGAKIKHKKPAVVLCVLSTLSLSCLAIDDGTAKLNARAARMLARQERYYEAFTEIGWLLRDRTPSIQKYAQDVLYEFPDIANARIAEFTPRHLAETACDEGTSSAIQSATESIVEVGRFASPNVTADALTTIEFILKNPEFTIPLERCQQAKKTEEDEKNKRATAEKQDAIVAATKWVPESIREFDTPKFCVKYGLALRGQLPEPYSLVTNLQKFFNAEAVRRHLRINKDLTQSESIKVGIDQCTLYASWGFPDRINRSVGPWGVHSQLIYGDFGPYVYVQNGVVRSYQD
jgi:hypothetical protein